MSLLDTASLIVTPNGYKEGKLYSVIPSDGSGDMSVTRATTATRVNSAGLVESIGNNVPRLDYSNGTCPSLLVEPQRTNLLTYSSSFDNADWNKTNCSITANNTTAPDGTTTADKLILANGQSGSSSDGTGIRQFVDIASGSYTYSIYAKAAEFTTIRFRENQVTGAFLTIDLTNGAITNGDVGQYINPTATLVSNGWYRITFQTPTLTALYKYSVRVSETGNGTSGIFIWGYQVELGSYATSYIPTTSASVTRNADVISKTGISSLIGQTEGTIFGELQVIPQKTDSMLCLIATLSAGTYANFFYIRATNGIPAVSVRKNDTTYVAINGTTALSEGFHKFAFAYKQNDFVLYVDGTQIGSDTSGEVPLCDEVYLGQYVDGFDREASKKSFALWKTRLTNTQLAQLTTI